MTSDWPYLNREHPIIRAKPKCTDCKVMTAQLIGFQIEGQKHIAVREHALLYPDGTQGVEWVIDRGPMTSMEFYDFMPRIDQKVVDAPIYDVSGGSSEKGI